MRKNQSVFTLKNGGWYWFIQLCRSGRDDIGALGNAAFCPGESNFFIYAGNNPVNIGDLTGYGKTVFGIPWKKFGGIVLETLVDIPIAVAVVAGVVTGQWEVVIPGIIAYEGQVWWIHGIALYLFISD